MPTMILAAGLGTRLRPLSTWRCKPLLPVGDRAALLHVLLRVAGRGGKVVVNAHHRAEELAAFVAREAPEVAVSVETELLGTAGGIAYAEPLLGGGDVLVWNADILAPVDVAAVARAPGTEATLVVRPGTRGTGNVGIDEAGRVVRLRDETVAPGEARGGEFLGIHLLGELLRRDLPEKGGLIAEVYLPALRRGEKVGVYETSEPWFDIGTLAAYLDANAAWLRGRGAGSWVGEGAKVAAGVEVEGSVVGAGAVVEGEGELARCVVWPGARAIAPLADAVVAAEGIVRR